MMWINYFIILSVAAVVSAGPANFITKCTASDSKCIRESAAVAIPIIAAGIPELGVKTLDPVNYKKLDASSPTLKLVLTDTTIVGLSKCSAKKMQRDAATSNLQVKLLCDLEADGHYEMKGRLLVLPIEGSGKFHIGFNQIQVNVDTELGETLGADGKKYWKLKNTKFSHKLREKAELTFENLFPNNALLGQAARELVKLRPNEIIEEVGASVIKQNIEKIINTIDRFFQEVPIEDLTL